MLAGRTIRRLQLRGHSEPDVRRMATRFEDALRTASLPEPGGRLIYVRRLSLGRIDRNQSATQLSRLLADAFSREGVTPLHAADPQAGNAVAVWFQDALEAHVLLAQRCLQGLPCLDWFWRLVLPGIETTANPVAAIERIAHSLAQLPEAAVAVPQWCAALVRLGHAEALAGALERPAIDMLRAAAGLAMPPRAEPREVARHRFATDSAVRQDAVALLSACMAMTGPAQDVARLRDQFEIESVRVRTGTAAPSPASSQFKVSRNDDPPQPPSAFAQAAPLAPAAMAAGRPSSQPSGRAPTAQSDSAPPTPPDRSPRTTSAACEPQSPHTPVPDLFGDSTVAGGVGFVLLALQRLGYAQWIEEYPEWIDAALPARIVAQTLARLHVPLDDPAWQLAAVPATPESTQGARDFVAPARWKAIAASGPSRHGWRAAGNHCMTDASGRLLLALTRRSGPRAGAPNDARARKMLARALHDAGDCVATAWLTALRRCLRRQVGMGLADFVRRPARLALTRTHLDVWFEPRQADMRIRRSGLDLDPGWMPWLGRVVGFHYEHGSSA